MHWVCLWSGVYFKQVFSQVFKFTCPGFHVCAVTVRLELASRFRVESWLWAELEISMLHHEYDPSGGLKVAGSMSSYSGLAVALASAIKEGRRSVVASVRYGKSSLPDIRYVPRFKHLDLHLSKQAKLSTEQKSIKLSLLLSLWKVSIAKHLSSTNNCTRAASAFPNIRVLCLQYPVHETKKRALTLFNGCVKWRLWRKQSDQSKISLCIQGRRTLQWGCVLQLFGLRPEFPHGIKPSLLTLLCLLMWGLPALVKKQLQHKSSYIAFSCKHVMDCSYQTRTYTEGTCKKSMCPKTNTWCL